MSKKIVKPKLSRFKGCLLGLAIGDALGMPFEGWRPHWIHRKVGDKLNDFLPAPRHNLGAGMWTDDTKMALHLAESIVRCGGKVEPEDVARSYVAWFDSGDLRGIGNATFESIMRLKAGSSWEDSGMRGKYAAGNGTAMRTAPVGLLDCLDPERLREDSRNDAIITHFNDEAITGSRAVNFLIAMGVISESTGARPCARTSETIRLIDKTIAFIGGCDLAANLGKAKNLLEDGVQPDVALSKLGTSGYVVETVASAVYCFLRTPNDFAETVSAAILAGGDTDTTGAVAGAISGAWNGVEGIPKRWVQGVESGEMIMELAEKIYKIVIGKKY